MRNAAATKQDTEPPGGPKLPPNPLALIGASRPERHPKGVIKGVTQRVGKIVTDNDLEQTPEEFNPSTVHPEHLNYFGFPSQEEPSAIEGFPSYDFTKQAFTFPDGGVFTVGTKVIGASSIIHLKRVRPDIVIKPTGKPCGNYLFGEPDFNGNFANMQNDVFVLKRKPLGDKIVFGSGETPFEEPLFTEAFLCGTIGNKEPNYTLGADTKKVYKAQDASVHHRVITITADEFEEMVIASGDQFGDNWNKDRFAVLQEYIVEKINPDAHYTFPIPLSRESNVPLSTGVTAIKAFGIVDREGKSKIVVYTLHGYKGKRGQKLPYRDLAPEKDTLVVTSTIFNLDKFEQGANDNVIQELIREGEKTGLALHGFRGRYGRVFSEDGV